MPAITGKSYHYERGNPKTFLLEGVPADQLPEFFRATREIELALYRDLGPSKRDSLLKWILANISSTRIKEQAGCCENVKRDPFAAARAAKAAKAAEAQAVPEGLTKPVLDPLPGLDEDQF